MPLDLSGAGAEEIPPCLLRSRLLWRIPRSPVTDSLSSLSKANKLEIVHEAFLVVPLVHLFPFQKTMSLRLLH